jgi:energy-coupling factor transport system ATP-binding protein
MEPEILILDEPTSELDPAGKVEIYQLLIELRKSQQVTILISGHDSEEMLHYTDRILVLDNGSIAWDGKPENLFYNTTITEKYGIRSLEADGIKQKNIIKKDRKNTDTNIVIESRNLSFEYQNGYPALHNINVKINNGEFVALIGKNGAGKTTFSKHLNGLLRPSEGQILINGRDIKDMTTAELSKDVGYVFQNPDHQIFAATVREEIEYGLKNQSLSDDVREKRILDALEFVGLEKFKERHPFTLGKGERQKLAVATILAMEPGILVIDEPTTGQDWDNTQKMILMMENLHRKGHTILAITHNMRLAEDYADRIIVFSEGKILHDSVPIELIKNIQGEINAN